jgi:hypothetical protein
MDDNFPIVKEKLTQTTVFNFLCRLRVCYRPY